jgi:PhoD-like phosphatase
MLKTHLILVEFMDSIPLADCTVLLKAKIIAGRRPIENPHVPGSENPDIEDIFDERNAIEISNQGTTNPQGEVELMLDLGNAFTQQRQESDIDGDTFVEGRLSLSINLNGLSLPANYHFQVLRDPDADLKVLLISDIARSIVGDTSDNHALLWFQLHSVPIPANRFACVLKAKGEASERSIPLTFDPNRAHTAIASFTGLKAATEHGYELHLIKQDGSHSVLTRGHFRTFSASPEKLTFAFASCHNPEEANSLNRWQALAARNDIDMALLIGDQIYGDNIEKYFPSKSWEERYKQRYNQLWNFHPVREVLRSRPMYMILDDHEVTDDWGVVPIDLDREVAALKNYNIFQQSHNPNGASAATIDYSFQRGPAAFYMTDSRTARGKDGEFPVMGSAQFERMKLWAASSAVRNSDLVFVIVPVPPAMLPIAELEELASLLAPIAGAVGGSLLGALAGFGIGLLGGPIGALGGAAIGAFVGAAGASIVYDHVEDTITEPDIRDAWTHEDNIPDLVRLFDLLFDIANDIGSDGVAGSKPKGVFIISGDYHFGAIHRVRSKRTDSGHDHRNNPIMLQLTSSPISTAPTNGDKLIAAANVVTSHEEFELDSDHYRAGFISHTSQRNFGRFSFEKLVGSGRRYRIQTYIEGETEALSEIFDLDLDARPVSMHNLIGELWNTRGRVTLLRVHEPNSGYGPATDLIDGEVVIQLDSEPGRAFGFQLRKDTNSAVRYRMLALMRDAFTHNRLISIDYLRTGLLNGTLIRATVL